jgi:hypothetical protein
MPLLMDGAKNSLQIHRTIQAESKPHLNLPDYVQYSTYIVSSNSRVQMLCLMYDQAYNYSLPTSCTHTRH